MPALLAALKAGETLILDRYIYSGIAFGVARGLEYDWCKAPDVGLPAPDVVVFLDIESEKAAERGGYGGERYEVQELQERVRENFKAVAQREGGGKWRRVDAGREMREVEEEIWEAAKEALEAARNGEEVRKIE